MKGTEGFVIGGSVAYLEVRCWAALLLKAAPLSIRDCFQGRIRQKSSELGRSGVTYSSPSQLPSPLIVRQL